MNVLYLVGRYSDRPCDDTWSYFHTDTSACSSYRTSPSDTSFRIYNIHCSWVRIGIWLCLFAVWIVPHSTMYKYAITSKLFIRTRTDLQRAVCIYSLVLSTTQCPCASYISKHSNTCILCPANKRTCSFWEGTYCNRLLVLKVHLH